MYGAPLIGESKVSPCVCSRDVTHPRRAQAPACLARRSSSRASRRPGLHGLGAETTRELRECVAVGRARSRRAGGRRRPAAVLAPPHLRADVQAAASPCPAACPVAPAGCRTAARRRCAPRTRGAGDPGRARALSNPRRSAGWKTRSTAASRCRAVGRRPAAAPPARRGRSTAASPATRGAGARPPDVRAEVSRRMRVAAAAARLGAPLGRVARRAAFASPAACRSRARAPAAAPAPACALSERAFARPAHRRGGGRRRRRRDRRRLKGATVGLVLVEGEGAGAGDADADGRVGARPAWPTLPGSTSDSVQ